MTRGDGSIEKKFAKLQSIENDHALTHETDYEFLHELQSTLLLALTEQGRLTQEQYRTAAQRLQEQRKARARLLVRENGGQR